MRASRLIAIAGLAALATRAWARKKDRKLDAAKPMFDRMDGDKGGFVSNGDLAAGYARLLPKSGH